MLGRRVYSSVRVVLESDSAIDKCGIEEVDRAAYQRYVESGWDAKHLLLVSGERPTVFVCKPLSYEQKIAREDAGNTMQRILYVARCGLQSVENYQICSANGETAELSQPEKDQKGVITEAWMREANLPQEHLIGIAVAINALSELPFPSPKPSVIPSGVGAQESKKPEIAVA